VRRFRASRNRPILRVQQISEEHEMLAAIFDFASFLFLLLLAVLTFAVAVAFVAPPASRPPRPSFYTLLLYLAAELAALVVAVMIVFSIADHDVLPSLIALALAAVIFTPQLVAKIPVPAAVTGFLNRK
jgi:hypothetical protein